MWNEIWKEFQILLILLKRLMIIMLRINMIWHSRHSILKYLNQNIIDEGIIITLKN
jgi:hypothetical protein